MGESNFTPLTRIVTAAVFSDAAQIVEEIALLKTRAGSSTSGATRAATAANPTLPSDL